MSDKRTPDDGPESDAAGFDFTPATGSTPDDTTPDLDDVVLEDDDPGLFDDLLSGEPIFENKDVLRPSYTPRELPHRDEQINSMATILVAALRGETPSNILIYGKTGTGKTASAKYVSQELKQTSRRYEVPCEVEYINCEVTDTKYRVLAQLANTFISKNRTHVDERIETLESLRDAVVSGDRRIDEHSPRNGSADAGGASTDVTSPDADPGGLDPDLPTGEFDDVADITARIEALEADRNEWEDVPISPKYVKGFRSLGSEVSTEKTTEDPAWLQDLEDTTERAGRAQDKEDLMERLRDLGYM